MRKLGINCGNYKGLDPIESIPYIKDAGFDCVFSGYTTDEYAGRLAETIANAGLVYDTIHSPFKNINDMWRAGECGEAMLKALTDCLDSCAHYGVPVMIVHLSAGDDAPCVNDIGHERFTRLVEHAGEVGVKIAFENQRKLANIAFAFEEYGHLPQVGFCWDTGHAACFVRGREYMPLFGDKLIALHIHDNLCEYNADLHMIPFDGLINFHHVAEQIRNSGYTGTLMLEVLQRNTNFYDDLTAEEYYAKAYRAVAKLRRLVDNT